jgi:membrane protein YqaA with SNARE-associated domain
MEFVDAVIGCLVGGAVCFIIGYFYHRAKREYLEAEREYLESLDKEDRGDE